MRILFVLRGVAGCGKSTWVKENKLEKFTLSSDAIRLLYSSPILMADGRYAISPKNDGKVWKALHTLLEERMSNGEFVVVDATHYKPSSINVYKKYCQQYHYKMFVIDFTDISKEEIYKRNKSREKYKQVPENVIDMMYDEIQQPLEGQYNIINKNDAMNLLEKFNTPIDVSKYKSIVCFGDIHGCIEPLKEYFEKNPINDEVLYVFVGDYFDRGIQNKEVLRFLLDNCHKKNFILLRGNHEIWVQNYVNDSVNGRLTDQFRKSLESFEELKYSLKELNEVLVDSLYLTYHNKDIVITHGGIPTVPTYSISSMQFIKGVGLYTDSNIVDDKFFELHPTKYSVHGHRNVLQQPIRRNNTFNLEGRIEFGDSLRIVEFTYSEEVIVKELYIKNNVFDKDLLEHKNN